MTKITQDHDLCPYLNTVPRVPKTRRIQALEMGRHDQAHPRCGTCDHSGGTGRMRFKCGWLIWPGPGGDRRQPGVGSRAPRRRDAVPAAERPVEIRQVAEARVVGDRADRTAGQALVAESAASDGEMLVQDDWLQVLRTLASPIHLFCISFAKGTLAAALIGLMRAGQKPARSAAKRTGRRPLSNPPLRRRGAATSQPERWRADSGGHQTRPSSIKLENIGSISLVHQPTASRMVRVRGSAGLLVAVVI